MSRIDKLIEELCPDGVEYKELEDVVFLTMGTSPSGSSFSSNAAYGIEFHQGRTYFGNVVLNHSNIYTSEPLKFAEPNSILMSVRAPVGDTNFTNRKIAIGRGLCSMIGKNGLMTRFLYYFINENINVIKNKSNGSTFEAINTIDIKKISIPIPSLSIQQEIVNILDKFTALNADLQAELEARNKQYEYYRNQLLNFEGKEVEWKMLGEVCDLSIGQKPNEDITQNGKFPFINAGIEPSGYLNAINSIENTITIPSRGAGGAGHVGYQRNKFWCGPLCYKINSKQNFLLTKYLYNYLKKIQNEIVELRQTGSIPAINRKELVKVQVPIPPLSDQQHIVSILDKFEELVNSGLPAEIEARRKQYEYYREKLLTFNKVEQIA